MAGAAGSRATPRARAAAGATARRSGAATTRTPARTPARPTTASGTRGRSRPTTRAVPGRVAAARAAAARTAREESERRRRAERSLLQPLVVAGAVAVILGVLYLAAPLMGQDLSAQIAHADFARDHPLQPVDLRWFGGSLQFGYSLYVPFVAAHVGPQLLGVVAAVLGTMLTTALFVRGGLARPTLGGVLAAVCQVANLTEGRIAFAVGLVFALAAVLPHVDREGHRLWSGVAALLAGAANPVAGLFVGVAALTLLVHGRVRDALFLGVGTGIGVAAVSVLFTDGGPFVYPGSDAARAAAVTVLVALVVPRWASHLWTGATIAVVMVAAAYALTTPVGANASRLALLFAIPVVAAAAEFVWWKVVALVAVAAVVQTPVVVGTLTSAGLPVTRPGYFTPLTTQLDALGVSGRIEIPEVTGHWEAAYVARDHALARGWLRQVDIQQWSSTFYGDDGPTPAAYRTFLERTSTQYVAVPDARLTFYGAREADLVRAGLPYLTEVWRDAHWTLYAVSAPTPVVAAPATGVTLGAAAITFSAPPGAEIAVNARWFRWLTLESPDATACIAPTGTGDETTVLLRTGAGGTYSLTSSLAGDHRHCP